MTARHGCGWALSGWRTRSFGNGGRRKTFSLPDIVADRVLGLGQVGWFMVRVGSGWGGAGRGPGVVEEETRGQLMVGARTRVSARDEMRCWSG